jgi:hypothetical protein
MLLLRWSLSLDVANLLSLPIAHIVIDIESF